MSGKPKDPLAAMRISDRDVQILEAVKVQGKTQREAAGLFGVQQPRICAILKRMEKWQGQLVPEKMGELDRASRLRCAVRMHKKRLEFAYQQAVGAWHDSRRPKHTIKHRGPAKGEATTREDIVQTQDGNAKHWDRMLTASERMVEFEGFDRYGNVDVSCEGRVPEAPPRTDEEAFRELKKRVMRGDFDTPGDEGVPGAWEQEMEARNAKLVGSAPAAAVERSHASFQTESMPDRRTEHCSVHESPSEPISSCPPRDGAMLRPTEAVASFHGVKGDGEPATACYQLLSGKDNKTSESMSQQAITACADRDELLSKTVLSGGEPPGGVGQAPACREDRNEDEAQSAGGSLPYEEPEAKTAPPPKPASPAKPQPLSKWQRCGLPGVTTLSVNQSSGKYHGETRKYVERFHPDEWNHP